MACMHLSLPASQTHSLPHPAPCPQPSTQGLVRELVEHGEAEGRRVLCPVPRVLPPLVEPEVVPKFLAGLTAVRGARGAFAYVCVADDWNRSSASCSWQGWRRACAASDTAPSHIFYASWGTAQLLQLLTDLRLMGGCSPNPALHYLLP